MRNLLKIRAFGTQLDNVGNGKLIMLVNAIKNAIPKSSARKSSRDIDRLVEIAQNSLVNGQSSEAIDAYESAIALGCSTVGVYCALGNLYLASGDVQRAERLAITALIKFPSHIPSHRLLGDSLNQKFPKDVVSNCYHGNFPPYIGEKYFPDSLNSISVSDSLYIERHLAYSQETTDLFPPKKIDTETHENFFLEKAHSPDRFVDVISDGSVWYDDFNIALFDGDSNRFNDHPVSIGYGPMLQHLKTQRDAFRIEGTAMLLGARGSCGFGHWMLDTLPALDAIEKCGFPIASIDKFIISGADLGFKRSTLESIGISSDRIYDVAQNPHVCADKLIVADVVTNMARRMGSWVPGFLRKEFLLKQFEGKERDHNNTIRNRRLYISRGGVGTRGVENEEELVKFIEQYGFEHITIESMSLQEQALLFNECETIIAPHGAALTNMAHCRQGTKVIEFFNAHIEPCFWIMGRLCKLDYYHHYCGKKDNAAHDSQDRRLRSVGTGINSSYTIDICELSNLFEYAGITRIQ